MKIYLVVAECIGYDQCNTQTQVIKGFLHRDDAKKFIASFDTAGFLSKRESWCHSVGFRVKEVDVE